ncbi:MAG: leucine-rich repeat protein [Oscillospiraceae bacterium]|nr:leucine-rich repeat protein [Oscillospiraceae bacterium]
MKRICSLLCAAMLGLSGIAAASPAELTVFAEEEVPTSGTCGENLTWEFDTATGTLTIAGSGKMDDFSEHPGPWSEFQEAIKIINLSDGVTSIGDYAFQECSGLTAVNLPDSLTSIGYCAFWGSSLTKITIPDSVTYIGAYAFEFSDLTTVTLPAGLKCIEDGTFNMCSNLSEITVPDGVTSIGMAAFECCSAMMSVTIPASVTSIGIDAFACCVGLTEIIIPTSVTVIGERAFFGCDNLTLKGYSGSYAETFAKENNIPFEVIGGTTPVEPDPADIDGNGTVEAADAVLFARYLAEEGTAAPKTPMPDLDGDGLITLLDLRKLLGKL